jgi:hypothetical protein
MLKAIFQSLTRNILLPLDFLRTVQFMSIFMNLAPVVCHVYCGTALRVARVPGWLTPSRYMNIVSSFLRSELSDEAEQERGQRELAHECVIPFFRVDNYLELS